MEFYNSALELELQLELISNSEGLQKACANASATPRMNNRRDNSAYSLSIFASFDGANIRARQPPSADARRTV
jgi:hypothetical protein